MSDPAKSSKQKSGCFTAPCICESTFQDKTYGPGKRLHNASPVDKIKGRCTVCGREK